MKSVTYQCWGVSVVKGGKRVMLDEWTGAPALIRTRDLARFLAGQAAVRAQDPRVERLTVKVTVSK